jgi:FAD synthetase
MVYSFVWEVIKWKNIWKKTLYPTANVFLDEENIKDWVYKCLVFINKKRYKWAWTYMKNKKIFEIFIIDFKSIIYWKHIKISLIEKIRDNKQFDNNNDLKEQITQDIKYVKNNDTKVITFGTFDIIHPGHRYYLEQAQMYWDILITIISTDINSRKFRKREIINNQEQRIKNMKSIWIANIVELWNINNPYLSIKKHIPDYICLWYDQSSYTDWLEKYLENNKLEKTKIIRLKWLNTNIYNTSKILWLK